MKSLFICIAMLCTSFYAHADFWSATISFPNTKAATTDILFHKDSKAVFVATTTGIYRSKNKGISWQQTSADDSIYCLAQGSNGMLAAGARGAVYTSSDNGNTWEMTMLNTAWTVREILFDKDNNIYAASGEMVSVNGFGTYVGDGIFFSDDNGKSFEQRNIGINNNKSVWNLAVNSQNEVYTSTNSTGQEDAAGLYTSNDKGLTWTRIPLNIITPLGTLVQGIAVRQIQDIQIGANDDILLSQRSVHQSQVIQFSAHMSRTEAQTGGNLHPFSATGNAANSLFEPIFDRMFLHSNGDIWASIILNGVFTSQDSTRTWLPKNDGFGAFSFCHFAEADNGALWAIQEADFKVFTSDTTYVVSVKGSEQQRFSKLYPNPTTGKVSVDVVLNDGDIEINVFNVTGQLITTLVKEQHTAKPHYEFDLSGKLSSGTYIMEIKQGDTAQYERIILH